MGSPYHRASRHTLVSLSLSYVWDIVGEICYYVVIWTILVTSIALDVWNFYNTFPLLLIFLWSFLFTVKVVCLKLIWHFPKITLSGHLKWNLSQIFGTLMVGSRVPHCQWYLPLFGVSPVWGSWGYHLSFQFGYVEVLTFWNVC